MAADPVLATSRISEIEVRRNLARLLGEEDPADAKRQFLAAALRAGPDTRFLTFDVRQAKAARTVGLEVVAPDMAVHRS